MACAVGSDCKVAIRPERFGMAFYPCVPYVPKGRSCAPNSGVNGGIMAGSGSMVGPGGPGVVVPGTPPM